MSSLYPRLCTGGPDTYWGSLPPVKGIVSTPALVLGEVHQTQTYPVNPPQTLDLEWLLISVLATSLVVATPTYFLIFLSLLPLIPDTYTSTHTYSSFLPLIPDTYIYILPIIPILLSLLPLIPDTYTYTSTYTYSYFPSTYTRHSYLYLYFHLYPFIFLSFHLYPALILTVYFNLYRFFFLSFYLYPALLHILTLPLIPDIN